VIELDNSFAFDSLSKPSWTMDALVIPSFNTTGYAYDSDAGTYTIYGLQNAYYTDSTISFTISGFTNPSTVVSGSTYTWTLYAYRFGTNTVLQRWSGKGPSDSSVAGTITLTSWATTNGYLTAATSAASSTIVAGATVYTTLKFSCQHLIPKDGEIAMTFSGVTFKNNYPGDSGQVLDVSQGYYDWDGNYISDCAWDGDYKVLTCTLAADLPASSSVAIYTLGTFTDTASVGVVATDGTSNIDTKSSLASIALAASSAGTIIASTPILTFSSDDAAIAANEENMAGDSGKYGLYLSFAIDEATAAATVITIQLPVTTGSSATDTTIAFGGSAGYGLYKEGAADVDDLSAGNCNCNCS
jgi:hypothetical protein